MMCYEPPDGAAFERLLEILVPEDGAVAAFAEVYVDESGTHDQSDMTVVAGYVFLRRNARLFQKEWTKVLRKEGIPYFRMSDCATGNGVFRDWPVDRRLAVEKKLIALTKEHSSFGFAIGTRPSVFRRVLRGSVEPYSFLLNQSLLLTQNWALNNGFNGTFAFFFEAGHHSQGQAGQILANITNHPEARKACKYGSHSFVPKEHAAAIQTADLLAWLSRNALEKRDAKKPARKDFTELLRHGHDVLQYFDETMLRAMRLGDKAAQAVAAGWIHTWSDSGWREHLPPELRSYANWKKATES